MKAEIFIFGIILCFLLTYEPKPNTEPPWNVLSSLSHSMSPSAWLVRSNSSYLAWILTQHASPPLTRLQEMYCGIAMQLWTPRTNHCLVCIYAQVIPRPWLVLLTKTWLTAWPSFWLPWWLFLLPVQWRLSTSFILEKTIWAEGPSPIWVVGLVCAVTIWTLRVGTMKMILTRKHSKFGL